MIPLLAKFLLPRCEDRRGRTLENNDGQKKFYCRAKERKDLEMEMREDM